MHVHYVEARWELACEELTLFMQLGAKYTRGVSLTPHSRDYVHSTCYTFQKSDFENEQNLSAKERKGVIACR